MLPRGEAGDQNALDTVGRGWRRGLLEARPRELNTLATCGEEDFYPDDGAQHQAGALAALRPGRASPRQAVVWACKQPAAPLPSLDSPQLTVRARTQRARASGLGRIAGGTILRVHEQADQQARLRPLKCRKKGDYRDIPLC